MKNYILLALISFSFGIFAQDVEFKSGNFKDNKDAFKAAKEQLDLGTEQWELGNAQVFLVRSPEMFYLKALEHFEKAYTFNSKSAELNFKIGVCHIHSTSKVKAIPYFKDAHSRNPLVDPFMNYYMGLVNQLEGNFKKAISFYNTFETEYRKADDFGKFVKQRKKECK